MILPIALMSTDDIIALMSTDDIIALMSTDDITYSTDEH